MTSSAIDKADTPSIECDEVPSRASTSVPGPGESAATSADGAKGATYKCGVVPLCTTCAARCGGCHACTVGALRRRLGRVVDRRAFRVDAATGEASIEQTD